MGAWLERRNAKAMLFAASFLATLAGYLTVSFDQGYGWGARYVHSAWGALPILGAAAIVRLRGGVQTRALCRWIASAAALSLVFATALRGWQINDYVSEHLSRRPSYVPVEGVRQFVFVHYDKELYTQDLVQNDPFLRQSVILFMSRGQAEDERMMQRLYPQARRVQSDARGEVWRFD